MAAGIMAPQRPSPALKAEESNPLANAIRQSRLAAGVTQKEISGFCDVTQSTFSLIEQGKRFPAVPVIYRIAEFLDIDVRQLLIITALSALDVQGIHNEYLAAVMRALKDGHDRK